MNDKVFSHLKKRYNEIYSIEPNTLHSGILDVVYKFSGKLMKTFPFKLFVPIALLTAFILYVVFGSLVTRLASLLQHGF